MPDILRKRGLPEITIVSGTSDHGMPLLRIKGNSRELFNRLPLVIMWPKGIK